MADSSITKRALATALRELMAEVPFEKINVAHICEKCNMNRKSFYYHFKDKYDLVNWIFDTEFIAVVSQDAQGDSWALLTELVNYLYENRSFYRKALTIKGQNSFSDHFREMLAPLVAEHLQDLIAVQADELSEILPYETIQQFHVTFITDGIICAIERWLQEKNCIAAGDFLALVQSCITKVALKAYRDINPTCPNKLQDGK